jgi:short-subunit dehydrogenase
MREQGFGHIINTASIAGLMPSPGGVAYATTKYGVVGLSTSLRAEAASSGIAVSVLCPGVIQPPILEGGGQYGRMLIDMPPETMRQMLERLKPMSPDRFARKALQAISKNQAIIVMPAWWKVFWWIHRLVPGLGLRLAQKRFQIMQTQLGVMDRT